MRSIHSARSNSLRLMVRSPSAVMTWPDTRTRQNHLGETRQNHFGPTAERAAKRYYVNYTRMMARQLSVTVPSDTLTR
jgi:hypothetical protein